MKPISKPLLAGLMATSVLTVLVLLQPVELPAADSDTLLADPRERKNSGDDARISWKRATQSAPAGQQNGFAPPPPPPPPKPAVLAPLPPPKPTAPRPDFSYFGRMVQDGKTYVFLGQGEHIEAIPVGGTFGSIWRIEAVTASGVDVKYLPLDEIRQLALSER